MTKMTIQGMHCAACERRITRTLQKEGVVVRDINHTTGVLDAELNGKTTDDVSRVITPLGYAITSATTTKKRVNTTAKRDAQPNAERHIMYNSIFALAITLLIQGALVATIYPRMDGWGAQYLIPLLLVPVALVANMAALWHQRAYRHDVSCMTGMMVGMTIGMTTGLTIGAIGGLLNGMFWGSVIGLVVGMIAGAYAGACCGAMGIMEGLMAGFMGGTMGAMLTVMMIAEHPVVFLAITVLIMMGILIGLARIVASEHEGRQADISPWPLWAVTVISTTTTIVLSAIMLLLPHKWF